MAITGSIQQKNGKWYAVLNMKDINGKRKPKWIPTGYNARGNKKKAEKFLEQQISKYSENALDGNANDILLADYFERWLPKIEKEVRPNTFRSYKGNMKNHIIPYFREKKIRLQQLCPVHLEDYYKSLKDKGLSSTTVKHHHQTISKALSDAIHDKLLVYNPASAAKSPSPAKFKAKYLTPKQLEQLMILIKGTVIELPVQLCSIYGFRRSEVLGLRWEYVDFEKRTITIAETLQQGVGGSYVDTTKNESSHRVLPLTQQAYDLLMAQKEQQIERSRVMGCYYYKSDYVCTWADGKVIQPNYLTRSFHNILKNSDLPMVRLHDLRHSTASNLIEQNVSIVNVANWLGHSSPTTTLNFYAHTNQTQKKMVANVIDDMLLVR